MNPTRCVQFLLVLALAGVQVSCVGSRLYKPSNGAEEALFSEAHRDVFPDDVRADMQRFRSTTVVWTGIVRFSSSALPGEELVLVEHHYWDWIEDYGRQREIAFLSPRGEGSFQFRRDPSVQSPAAGAMAIVYGVPQEVLPDSTIVMRARFLRTLPRELYTTEMFDYGRNPREDFRLGPRAGKQ